MKFEFYLAIFLLVLGKSFIGQSNSFSVKDYGAIGDGKHDDLLAIQKTFDVAKNTKNSTIYFEKGKQYLISKPIKLYSNLNGNGSAIKSNSTQALSIISPNIKIENVTISGPAFKYLRIDQNNITLNNCNISANIYFALLIINANSFTLTNSTLKNNFTKEKSYALHSSSGVQDIQIIGNKIYGGIIFKNNSQRNSGGFLFEDNDFSLDYSGLPQSVKLQNDAFTFYSNTNVQFINNRFKAVDINRLFKISANAAKDNANTMKVTGTSPDNFRFEGNVIDATSSNGKQLFDFYIGTKNVTLSNNTITAKGFSTLFENKTKINMGERLFSLVGNTINFDSEILYFDGQGKSNLVLNAIEIKNNTFNYDSQAFKFMSRRAGQSNDLKFNFVFNVRNVDRFIYDNNKLKQSNNNLDFSSRYFFYIANSIEVGITNSSYIGGLKFEPLRENSVVKTVNNTVLKTNFKNTIITSKDNKIKYQSFKN
ncbi:glycosyl hydrolase family 28-related protein [Pedobacter antarcticus]|uniref:glycosyl hydrolase family 28-related protein n=1 Tax=Pedobacter antarcticus TaxID=34086 RepID=UPI000882ADB6|nr:glycosyl hydrolase family 28-related protein [Pedobacter antarcticus]SDM17265.1 Pectate lyase superfamily protein [Pedobacter antarcticus]